MLRLGRILFPTDFSDRTRHAALYVEAMASHFKAEVILLHVVQPPTYNTPLEDALGSRWESFDKIFTERGVPLKRLTEHGEPAGRIVECARANSVDLIMMPTHGLGVYRRLIIGSNTAKVLHDTERPVWTGVHMESALPPPRADVQRVLCAVDLKPHSAQVLQWASGFARSYGASATAVHVTANSVRARPALDGLRQTAGCDIAVRIEAGNPAKVVAHVAKEMAADLLVIGRSSLGEVPGRLEITAYSIIRRSPCPVVSV
ncbi:MAG TPA: universal stress protein [Bryobacteraceae bacterium]|nr:universal stress protein [Bryobacteraceae bacterium]